MTNKIINLRFASKLSPIRYSYTGKHDDEIDDDAGEKGENPANLDDMTWRFVR